MFGILLKEMRKAKRISQEELADGICSRESLKKYESGQCDPEKLCADALLQRLEKTVDKYYIRLDDKEYELARCRTQIQIDLRRGRLSDAERAIFTYRNLPGADSALHRQFLAFVRAELLRRRKAPFEEQMEVVMGGLAETLAGKIIAGEGKSSGVKRRSDIRRSVDISILEKRPLHLLELFLLQRYAILLEDAGEIEKAVCWYQVLLARFARERRGTADQQKLYPLIAYRLAGCMEKEGRFDEALPLVEKALQLLRCSGLQNAMYIMLRELEFTLRETIGGTVSENEKENLCCLKEILGAGKEEIYWQENYYPTYLESYLCSVNAMLRERRFAQRKTRERLVGTVCDARTLERQEKNGAKPQKRVWKGLFQELGLSYLKYDAGIVTDKYEDYQKFDIMIRAYDKRQMEKAWRLYKELLESMDMGELTNRQFERYWGAELRYRAEKISREKRNEELWDMLAWTLPLENKESCFSCWLTEYEREALILIAWDCGEDEIEEMLLLLKPQFYRNRKRVEQTMEMGFYQEILYCIARGYMRSGNLWRAERYIMLAIGQRRYQDWGLPWDRLLFLRLQIEEKRLGLWGKKYPLESSVAISQWARLAWAAAKENGDSAMCDFLLEYFKIINSYEKNLD